MTNRFLRPDCSVFDRNNQLTGLARLILPRQQKPWDDCMERLQGRWTGHLTEFQVNVGKPPSYPNRKGSVNSQCFLFDDLVVFTHKIIREETLAVDAACSALVRRGLSNTHLPNSLLAPPFGSVRKLIMPVLLPGDLQ